MTGPEFWGLILGGVGVVLSGCAWRWAWKAAKSAEEGEKRTRQCVAMSARALNELLKAAKVDVSLRIGEDGEPTGLDYRLRAEPGTFKVTLGDASMVVTRNAPKSEG